MAPSLVLSVILGWTSAPTCALLGGLGGHLHGERRQPRRQYTHAPSSLVILATWRSWRPRILGSLPAGVGPAETLAIAGWSGRLNALQLHFDPNDRYNLWSAFLGGFFLQLSYSAPDQSQVGR